MGPERIFTRQAVLYLLYDPGQKKYRDRGQAGDSNPYALAVDGLSAR
jgi:hypothetical protein